VRGSSVQPSNALLLRRRDGVPFQISLFVPILVSVPNLRDEVEMPAAHAPVAHVRLGDADARRQRIHMAACRRSAKPGSTAA